MRHTHPPRRVGTAAALAVLAAAALTTAGCSGTDERAPDNTLRVVTPFRVKSLDPVRQGLWAPEWGYGELLMRPTEQAGVEPWLLKAVDRVDDTGWRLTLREGVRFHNGRRLDGAALAACLQRHLTQNPTARAALPGATASASGSTGVLLRTTRPAANLPALLADESLFTVFDTQAVDAAGGDPAKLLAQRPYTGPFVVSALDAQQLVLRRNPGYWGGPVRLAGATIRFVPDGQARVLAVRGGQADLAFYPPTESLRSLSGAREGDPAVVRSSPLPTSQLRAFLNTAAAPLDDTAVRRALALAVDYRALAEQVLDRLYQAPTGLYPSTLPYAVSTTRTDRAAAGALLDQAGWRTGPDGVRARGGQRLAVAVLAYSPQPDTRTVATALQAQLRTAGFEATVREVPENYTAMRESAGWHLGLSFDAALGTGFDPVGPFNDFLRTGAPDNLGRVQDQELDRLVDQLGAAFDTTERDRLLARAQQLVMVDRAYLLMLAQRPARVVAGRGWQRYPASSVLMHLTAATGPDQR